MQSRWRTLFAGLVIGALIWIGLAPTLHAHQANAHRPLTIVHRHTQSHGGVHLLDGVAHASSLVAADDSDHDEDAVWMTVRGIERSKSGGVIGSVVTLPETRLAAAAPEGLCAAVPKDDSLPHGPPKASSTSRAPPTPAV